MYRAKALLVAFVSASDIGARYYLRVSCAHPTPVVLELFGMSESGARRAPTILERVPAGERFSRVRCWAGDGEVIMASTSEGCVVVAPPAMPLTFGEPQEQRAHWRLAWYPASEHGVDLDGGPQQEERSALSEIWPLEQVEDVRPFLRAMFLANARHRARAHQRFYGVVEAEGAATVELLRREWEELFPGERWPLDAPEVSRTEAPRRASRLSEVIASAAERLVAVLVPRRPGWVHGTDPARHDASEDLGEERAQRVQFGPALSLVQGGEGSTPVVEVDFDLLWEAHPDLDELDATGLAAHVLTHDDEVVGTAFFVELTGIRRAPVELTQSVDLSDVRVALAAATR